MSLSPEHRNNLHHMARGVKVAEGIKAANQLPFGWGECPVLSRWAPCNRVSLSAKGGLEIQSLGDAARGRLSIVRCHQPGNAALPTSWF